MDTPTTDRAYAAGLLDGEGSISISRISKPAPQPPVYRLVVNVSNSDREMAEWLQRRWGGKIQTTPSRNGWKAIHIWSVPGRWAEPFLREIMPYLRTKADQAKIALEFIALLEDPVQVRELKAELRERLQALNRRGAQVPIGTDSAYDNMGADQVA